MSDEEGGGRKLPPSIFEAMKSGIEIINKRQSVEINIEGTIGVPEGWQFDNPDERVATYEKFRDALKAIENIDKSAVIVNIRSTGGDVNDALLIHDALQQLDARITTRCYGYTASAATIIAQAASEGGREMSSNALYLIHNSMCAAEGNAEELAGKLELLRKTDERIAALYAARSGRPAEEFEALMGENSGNGKWLSADDAVAAGLVDVIIKSEPVMNFAIVDEKEEPIHQNTMSKIKNTFVNVLNALGIVPRDADGETEISAEQVQVLDTKLGESMAQIQNLTELLTAEQSAHSETKSQLTAANTTIADLQAQLAKAKAQPTTTKPVEDPTIADAGKLEGNAASYAADVEKFKK